MENGTGIGWSSVLFEVVGFWLIVLLVIYFLLKGLLKGNVQKRNEKIIELENRIERLEKHLDKE
ncbi:hypothetical protein [Bacillus sp. EAC]|uniref:hypothetical protein n=1 Tax=Bacillus sp. EAC TaxID=1978338 RepID=UPI000B453E69|nr:hypothetical protein [Bacillus sp. EAC]